MKQKLQKRINAPLIKKSFERSRVTALLGARRVGKTTLLESYMAAHPERKWIFINMDIREKRQQIEAGGLDQLIEESALRRIGKGEKLWVAIDEAQKCPALFDQVKVLYDRYKGQDSIKFIFTGSGHLNLHQLASESLAGRVELMHLREFNLAEMAGLLHPDAPNPLPSVFDLLINPFSEKKLQERYQEQRPLQKLMQETLSTHLVWGGLPEVLEEKTEESRQRYIANYLQTYLENDVRAIETISDLKLYQNLMKSSAEQTGSLRDDQKFIQALGCARNTLNKYRGYLTATMQFYEVYPYVNSTVKRLVKSPKGYLINNGLVSYLTGISDYEVLNATGLLGHRFENWALNELLTWTDSLTESHEIYFWRTSGGAEVDFIALVGANVLPIEVTFSSQIHPQKIRHLQSFLEKEPRAKWGICLYNGPYKLLKEERIICLPSWMI